MLMNMPLKMDVSVKAEANLFNMVLFVLFELVFCPVPFEQCVIEYH